MSEGNFRQSFGYRIFKAFGLTIIVVALAFSTVLVLIQSRTVHNNLMRQGRMLAALLANNARAGVFSENREMLGEETHGFMGQQGVAAVFVYNADNRLIYAEQKSPFAGKSFVGQAIVQTKGAAMAEGEVAVTEGGGFFSFVAPVVLDMTPSPEESFYIDKPAKPRQAVIGFVEILLDAGVLRSEIRTVVGRNALAAAAFLVSGVIAIYFVLRKVMEPLKRLTGAVRALGEGERVEKVPVESRDEIGRLAEDFNAMFENLQRREEEKQMLEERLRHAQKMEAVGTLARGIAHDFNNILATIKGSLFVMEKQTSRDGSLRTYGVKIHTAIEKAQTLVQGLFTFSKNQAVNLQQVDLNAVVRKAGPIMSSILGEGVELRISPCDGELSVRADIFQMEQVLMNLGANSRDAMPDGGTLTVSTARIIPDQTAGDACDVARAYALLTVADTGMGMAEEMRGRIFEPFFSTKEPGKGTGLGLSIVYGIIQQHQGYIEVNSKKGVETVFSIYLPLMREEKTDLSLHGAGEAADR